MSMLAALGIFAVCWTLVLFGILRFERYLKKRRDREMARAGDMNQEE